ncbi:uncharacterized protein LOC134217924 [Armigeres subalbatus]|uniref:uncharacterized protein LOC134217924 n=1 Tax=Armigeres subalbatus TaxID=124917 RepID=UPI002ED0A29A
MSMRLVLITLAVLVCAAAVGGSPLPFDSSSQSQESGEFIESLERQCLLRTGSADTFEQLVVGFAFVPICIAGHLDFDGLNSDLGGLDETNRVQFFDTYCPQVNQSLQCINPVLGQLRKCFEGEELGVLDILINMLPEAVNLICKDHGEIFFRLEGPEYEKCMQNFEGYAVECSGKISNATEALDLSKFGEEHCRELSDFRTCIADKLEICKAPGIIDLFDLFYKPVVKSTSCVKYINLDERNAVETNEI